MRSIRNWLRCFGALEDPVVTQYPSVPALKKDRKNECLAAAGTVTS
jgi:hypothetical protein